MTLRQGRSVAFAALLTTGLHFLWEMAQSGLFADFGGPWSRHWVRCARAAVGDLLIAAAAYLVASIRWRRWWWPCSQRWIGPALIWLAAGELVTIVFERHAIRTARWTYSHRMPTAFGVGLSPLLQWLIVPLLTLLWMRLRAGRANSEAADDAPTVSRAP